MEKPYLIQRCTSKDIKKEDIVGFDSAFSLDYMGSSEFEFGTLPASLKTTLDKIYNYYKTDVKSKDERTLYVIAHSKEQKDEILKYLPDLVDNKIRLKESSKLQGALRSEKYCENDLWWDLNNHCFLALGKETAHRIVLALVKYKEKKLKEKK